MLSSKPVIGTWCRIRGTPLSSNLTQNLLPKLSDFFKISAAAYRPQGPDHFLKYNEVVYPPQEPGEPPRPAYICHQKVNIKYQIKKMYPIACLVRGKSIDEAIIQLKQIPRKGAVAIMDTLKEAQELAVKEHNVEFKSNLWVAESFVGKGAVFKGVRRHAKMRVGEIRYMYCHYFVRLEEGSPPERYYWEMPRDGPTQLERYVDELRKRKIINSL